MKTREDIITSMCYTYRHDYGLTRDPAGAPWVSGMTDIERKGLWKTMEQIYDNNVVPLIQHYKQVNKYEDGLIPPTKEQAESMVKVGMFYLKQYKDELS